MTSLDAQYRWCLTGTPIQNRLEDLGALVSFLRIPYLESVAWFRSNIVASVECGCKDGVTKLRSLLKCICIRRKKDVLQLQEPIEQTVVLHLTAQERSQYQSIAIEQRRAIEHAVSNISTRKASAGLCQAILRLRLSCNHGFATKSCGSSFKSRDSSPLDMDEKFSFAEQTDRGECASCKQTIESFGDHEDPCSGQYTDCDHLICFGCVDQENKLNGDGKFAQFACPVCGTATSPKNPGHTKPSNMTSENSAIRPNTKLKALLDDLQANQYTEKR